MFETQYAQAQSAISALTSPIWSALDSFDKAAEAAVSDLNGQLKSAQSTIGTQAAMIQSLHDQLAGFTNVSAFRGQEKTPWLLAGGTLANTPGTGSTAVGVQAQPTTLNAYFENHPAAAYADKFWYKQNGADPTKKNYHYEVPFFFGTDADAAAPQCLELDIQQCIGGLVFNCGLQFDFAENMVRVWNRSIGSWVATGTACQFWKSGTWMRVVLDCHRDSSAVYYDSLTLNGVNILLGQSFSAPNLGLADSLNNAIQLDGNKAGVAYRVYVDDVNFIASRP